MPTETTAQLLDKDILYLARHVGPRPYGSDAEANAAQYVADRMGQLRLSSVRCETFPVAAFRNAQARCEVLRDGRWLEVPCLPGSNTAGTPQEGVEGDLVPIEDVRLLARHRDLEGKIGLVMGGYGETPRQFRSLMASGLVGILYVDDRFPNEWPVDVGVPAVWLKYATLPLVSLPYTQAWRITEQGFPRVRLSVAAERYRSRSQNVIGELPGSTDEVVVVSAHHDSTPRCAAPDDNAVGVAAMLELARVLSLQGRTRRTVRFISFGAEEALSEGARQHVMRLKRRGETDLLRFVLNNDSIGSRLGRTTMWIWGPPQMGDWAERWLREAGVPVAATRQMCPFSDHFPFNAVGVPSLWFHRTNMASGRFYHHSVHDTMGVLSTQRVAELIALEAGLLRRIARARTLPWKGTLSDGQTTQMQAAARDYLSFR